MKIFKKIVLILVLSVKPIFSMDGIPSDKIIDEFINEITENKKYFEGKSIAVIRETLKSPLTLFVIDQSTVDTGLLILEMHQNQEKLTDNDKISLDSFTQWTRDNSSKIAPLLAEKTNPSTNNTKTDEVSNTSQETKSLTNANSVFVSSIKKQSNSYKTVIGLGFISIVAVIATKFFAPKIINYLYKQIVITQLKSNSSSFIKKNMSKFPIRVLKRIRNIQNLDSLSEADIEEIATLITKKTSSIGKIRLLL